ncbi:MAG TPA: hypothetical protein VLJ58_18415 [Ramlibacter sp.]|nr:hypothetical protein [Ramlibacter sp.]
MNRSLDWRFGVLILVGLSVLQVGALTLVVSVSWPIWVLALAAFLVAYWLADVLIVRLVVAGKKRKIPGFTQ